MKVLKKQVVLGDPKQPEHGLLILSKDEYKQFAFVVSTEHLSDRKDMVKINVPGAPEKGYHITTISEYNRFRSVLYPIKRPRKKVYQPESVVLGKRP